MTEKKIVCTEDWCRFKKGDEAIYIEGNDVVSRVMFKGQEVWIKNKYFDV